MKKKEFSYPGAKDVNDLTIIRVIKSKEATDYFNVFESNGVTPTTIFTLNNESMVYFNYCDSDENLRILSPRIYMGFELTQEELLKLRDEFIHTCGEDNKFITYINNLINDDNIKACMSFNGDIETMDVDSICYEEFLKGLKDYYEHCIEIDKSFKKDSEYHEKSLMLVKSEIASYNKIRGI